MTQLLRRYLVPTLVHLLIGVPTGVALLCARWYWAHGHCNLDDDGRSGLHNCTYDQIEDAGFVLIGLVMFGVLVVLLLFLYDVFRPLYAARPLTPRLLTLPAVLLPFLVYMSARS